MKVIHDGDAAYEDIMAAMILLHNAELIAATVCYGESTPKIGAKNMLRVCQYFRPELNIPVGYGKDNPFGNHGNRFPEFITKEANSILADSNVPELEPHTTNIHDNAVQLLYDTLSASADTVTIVATGPLTNIAELIARHPDVINKIHEVVIMGGAVHVPGNIDDIIQDTQNKVAEWNIYADPVAAQQVFQQKGLNIRLVPIDITRQMPMTRQFYNSLARTTKPQLILVKKMLGMLLANMGEKLFFEKLQFWDSLAAMLTLDEQMADYQSGAITVDAMTGQTTLTEQSDRHARVRVAIKLLQSELAYHQFKKFITAKPQQLEVMPQAPGTPPLQIQRRRTPSL